MYACFNFMYFKHVQLDRISMLTTATVVICAPKIHSVLQQIQAAVKHVQVAQIQMAKLDPLHVVSN